MRWLIAIATTGCLIGVAVAIYPQPIIWFSNRGVVEFSLIESVAPEQPVGVFACRSAPKALRQSNVTWFRDGNTKVPLANAEVVSPSLLVHLMRCFGPDVRVDINGKNPAAMDMLLDQQLSLNELGYCTVVRTRYGARFPTLSAAGYGNAGDESHRDQCLASLAEFGVPLSTQIQLKDSCISLLDVLKDSVANFDLQQEELEWTVMAYAMYMPHKTGWKNRFGQSFTFDQCANELINRPLEDASCGGTHRFMALTFLIRVQSQVEILSSETNRQIHEFLNLALKCAERNQQSDGSWNLGWNHRLFSDGDQPAEVETRADDSRLIMTGHIAEWLLYLPQEFAVDQKTLLRSSNYLSIRLAKATERDLWRNLCPYTHAFCSMSYASSID